MNLLYDLLLVGTYLHFCVQYSKRNRQRPVTPDNCAKELLNEFFIGN